jgi:16S rRNA (adenine1518-N6/adenine1519-N6)-dimethyltransferase
MMGYAEPKPLKRLGQNFLRSQKAVNQMITAADVRGTDLVVEIGAGMGAITRALAGKAREVLAYEIDPNLVMKLREEMHWAKNVTIHEGNVLAKDWELPKENYKVVASLPYYITSPILEKLLTAEKIASVIVLMVQKEVAQKIASKSPDASYLSNFVRLFGEPQIVATVAAAAFFPKPQVDSAILQIRTKANVEVERSDIEQIIAFLHAGFTEPRKKLHNGLAAGLHVDADRAKQLIFLAEIDSDRRAETLELREWLKLYEVVKRA